MGQQTKKPTNAQLQRRIKDALAFIPRTKDTKSIFFSDKGLRLTINEDTALIATGYHTHIFSAFTQSGVSKPYLYTKTVIELGLEYGIVKDDKGNPQGYDYAIMLQTLKDKGMEKEYDIVYYYSWYAFNIFAPLYLIGETVAESFLVYLDYVNNIARNSVLLSEQQKDLTNKAFVSKYIDYIKDMTKDLPESVVLHKLTDEELAKANADALNEHDNDELLKKSAEQTEKGGSK